MTDKTSTAPVMSLQQVRDALHEAHNSPGLEAVLDSCVAAIDAHLTAPTPDVVGGDVVACRYCVVAPNGNVGKWFFTDEVCVSSGCLEVQPLYAAPRVQGDADHADAIELLRAYQSNFGSIKPDDTDDASAWERIDKACRQLAAQPKGDGHPDDVAVDAFAEALKDKLAEARAKGRGGWNSEEPGMQQRLSDMLRNHVDKGDPRDVANFAMFLHQRGEAILPAEQTRGDGVACGRCGASSEAEASTRCIPDGDSCPGCDEPIASTWERGTRGDGVTDEMWHSALRAFRVPVELDRSGRHAGKTAAALKLALEAAMAVAPRQVVPDGWQPIETAPKGVKVIAGYRNQLGKWRSVMARYYGPGTLELADDQVGDDDGFAPAGWYEETETHETTYLTDEVPTHWMRLAAAPSAGRMGVDRG